MADCTAFVLLLLLLLLVAVQLRTVGVPAVERLAVVERDELEDPLVLVPVPATTLGGGVTQLAQLFINCCC